MYVCMYVCIDEDAIASLKEVCMYACMSACICVCMYVLMRMR